MSKENGIFPTMSAAQKFGASIEMWVMIKLAEMGVDCDPHLSFFDAYDFSIFDGRYNIEVKAASAKFVKNRHGNYVPRWAWLVRPSDLIRIDFYVLVAVVSGQKYAYVVPGEVFKNKKLVEIRSHPNRYKGWLDQYLDKWELITSRTEPSETDTLAPLNEDEIPF